LVSSVSTLTQIVIYALALVIFALVAVSATRMSRQRDYRFGRGVVVRCRDGHLFTTTWIMMKSLKAIRLGLGLAGRLRTRPDRRPDKKRVASGEMGTLQVGCPFWFWRCR
jgi:hypothetical protein